MKNKESISIENELIVPKVDNNIVKWKEGSNSEKKMKPIFKVRIGKGSCNICS